eukprot:COSAG02_NODE_1457_length_12507_cov_7.416989_1_plen_162_part_00
MLLQFADRGRPDVTRTVRGSLPSSNQFESGSAGIEATIVQGWGHTVARGKDAVQVLFCVAGRNVKLWVFPNAETILKIVPTNARRQQQQQQQQQQEEDGPDTAADAMQQQEDGPDTAADAMQLEGADASKWQPYKCSVPGAAQPVRTMGRGVAHWLGGWRL